MLSGGEDQDNALSAELNRRGIEAFSCTQYGSNAKVVNNDGGNNNVLPPGAS